MPLQITPENSLKIEDLEAHLNNLTFGSLGDVNFSNI